MKTIRFGSVCSGIEAASVAWNPLGWKAAWLSEIEPFPSAVLAHHYPDVPNLGDMTKLPDRIRIGDVEAPDVFCGGTPCFTAGQMVLTATGYRAIEELVPGDEVMTHAGRLRKVLRIGSKTAPVGRLSAVGLPDGIVCTEEHPFLSSRWRNQSTKRNNGYTRIETCTEPEWVAAKEMPGRQWCALVQVDATTNTPDSRLFDERTAMYVAGMYLGDGWIRGWTGKNKKAVMLGINDSKYLKLLSVIGHADHSISRERTVVKVCFGDTRFANWLESNFGSGSHLKKLPAWVLGHKHRDALLQGYLDTDGCVSENKETINTTSKSLAYGIADLLNIEGRVTSVSMVKTADACVIEGRTVNQRDYFQVRSNHLSICRKARVRHGYLMRSVQSFVPIGEETVFNIEVEEDNSFILAGAIVHNCQAFSVAGLRKSLDDARGNLSLVFCEIADAIDSVRLSAGNEPAIIFWENVPGVLSTSDNAFGCFLAGLAGEDDPLEPPGGKWTNAGYVLGPKRAVAWRVTDAQYFGVAQRRRRVFVVASARTGFDPAAVLFEFEGVRRDTAPSRETREGAAATVIKGAPFSRTGNERVETEAVITMAHGQGGAEIGFDRGPTLTCNHEAPIAAYALQDTSGRDKAQNGRGWNADGTSYTLDAAATQGVAIAHVDTMPCMTAGGPAETSHNQISGQMRDQYVVPVCVTGQVTHTLKAEGFDASEDGTGRGQPIVVHGTQDPCHDEHIAFALGRNSGQENAIAFQTRGSNIDVGEISGTIGTNADRASGSSPCIAFSCKDHGGDAGPISPTLRSMGHDGSHANAGWQVAVAFAENSRAEVRLEGGDGQRTGAISTGGGKPGQGVPMIVGPMTACGGTENKHGFGWGQQDWENGYCQPTPQMSVRRLLPEECELLQGFPKGYTKIPWKAHQAWAKKKGTHADGKSFEEWLIETTGRGLRQPTTQDCPDGPRYKALGNSWAVPNVRWIGHRIDAQLRACAGSISKQLVTDEA